MNQDPEDPSLGEGNKQGILFADKLLSRKADQTYLQEWTNLLARPAVVAEGLATYPTVIFRLGGEWFGLSVFVFSEVCEKGEIHEIPHRRSKFLMGIINHNGQLRMCVDLHGLLDVSKERGVEHNDLIASYSRMIAISKDSDYWLFPVDEIFGIYHLKLNELENVPVSLAKSTSNFLKGIFTWNEKHVGWIDEELLLSSLKRSIL